MKDEEIKDFLTASGLRRIESDLLDSIYRSCGMTPDELEAEDRAKEDHKRRVHQGCHKVLGHGSYCSEGYLCGTCEAQAKRQADALAAGWPLPR